MTLIQEIAEENLFLTKNRRCVIIKGDKTYRFALADIPFKLLVCDVDYSFYDLDINEQHFILRSESEG